VGVEQRDDGKDHVVLDEADGVEEVVGLARQVGLRAQHPLRRAGRAG
jgi:hypothetical protein